MFLLIWCAIAVTNINQMIIADKIKIVSFPIRQTNNRNKQNNKGSNSIAIKINIANMIITLNNSIKKFSEQSMDNTKKGIINNRHLNIRTDGLERSICRK